jgi:hypothetical protein
MLKKNVCKFRRKPLDLISYDFYISKQLTEKHCLQNCLDVSLDLAQQINALWEPLQQLAPLFNIHAKADFLVNI